MILRMLCALLVALLAPPATPIDTLPDPTSVAPISHPFNASLRSGSDDIPEDDPRMQTYNEAEQVHLQYWGEGAILVSWVTDAAEYGPHTSPRPPAHPALVRYWPENNHHTPATMKARAERYFYTHTFAGAWNYTSPTIHHALLRGLEPTQRYHYQVSRRHGSRTVWRAPLTFTVPPAVGDPSKELVLGLMADVGQTYNSSDTMAHMLEDAPDVVVHVGDISYADDYQSNGTLDPWLTNTSQPLPSGIQRPIWGTFQHRWDLWGRLAEPLTAAIPHLYNTGNHEIERQSDGQQFVSYAARFPPPHQAARSPSPLFYSVSIGLVHLVFITSYAPFHRGSAQWQWLQRDLKGVDRMVTPWLVVTLHAPIVNSYASHFGENECMRLEVEPLLHAHHVDLVFHGHTHAYERSHPTFNHTIDRCGPVYITIGDGGNIERLAIPFVENACPDPDTPGPWEQPEKCVTYVEGRYCPRTQPPTSAFREPSFGHGLLRVHNHTRATWTWNRNQEPHRVVADSVVLVQNHAQCAAGRADGALTSD